MFNKKLQFDGGEVVSTGWLPSLPDLRDYDVEKFNKKLSIKPGEQLSATVDLRGWFSPVDDQGQIGSCTAQAAVGIVEYFQKRTFNKYLDGSRRFTYKTTRNLMQETGDTGAYLRNTMASLVLFGVPNEKYFPYTDDMDLIDEEPSAFVYGIADNFEALEYFCHDPLSANKYGKDVLTSVKSYIEKGIPSMFGFYGFPSFGHTTVDGGIPFPGSRERAQWGHAIVACGYDDNKIVDNTLHGTSTEGALLIRNSWSTEWGDEGYGWLPYKYVTYKLANDFWSLLSMEWVDTDKFDI